MLRRMLPITRCLGLFAAALLWAGGSPAPVRADGAQQPLTLAQAVSLASRQNANVALAQLRLGEAEAKTGQSRAALLPSVTGQAIATDRTFNVLALGFAAVLPPGATFSNPVIGPVYETETRVKITQTLFDAASWRKLGASRYGELGARSDIGASSEGAAYGAALAYLRAARAAKLVEARENEVLLSEGLLSLAEAQLAAGTSPNIDVTRARTQVVSSRGGLVVARNQRDRTRIDLARAIGLDPATAVTLSDTLDSALGASDAPGEAAAAVTFALDHRTDLRSEAARLQRARADRAATAAERLPRVDVSADLGGSGEHLGDVRNTYTYALAVTLPLIDGLKRESRLKEQADLVRESEVRGKDLREQVAADVSTALLDLASGLEQQAVAAEQLKLAEDELDQSRERFVSGVAGNIEVINAQASLIKAHDADIDARFAVAGARAALAHAAGVAQSIH